MTITAPLLSNRSSIGGNLLKETANSNDTIIKLLSTLVLNIRYYFVCEGISNRMTLATDLVNATTGTKVRLHNLFKMNEFIKVRRIAVKKRNGMKDICEPENWFEYLEQFNVFRK